MSPALSKLFAVGRAAGLAVVVVVAGGSGAWVASAGPARSALASTAAPSDPKPARDGRDVLVLPLAVVTGMGLQTAPAAVPTRPRSLPPFSGVLAADTNHYAQVRSRFAGEVVSLGSVLDPQTGSRRTVRDFDTVQAGDVLAVVWSKDLGEKKSELVDAASQLRAARATFQALTDAVKEGAAPAARVRDADRAVQTARVAVERAERTLRTWRLTDDEIAAVRAEADRLADPAAPRAESADWAKVEVRASQGGMILEKNVFVGGMVDPSATLFYLADLSELVVSVQLYEDDLPAVQALPRPVRWAVTLPSQPGAEFAGTLDQVRPVIDPVQHTAVAVGRVANPDGRLKVGQFVTARVELPPAAGEVELPSAAVVEDGTDSLVFVRPDPAAGRFVRRPVQVRRRFADVVYVAADPAGVRPGEQVVTAGALLLRDALDQLPPAK